MRQTHFFYFFFHIWGFLLASIFQTTLHWAGSCVFVQGGFFNWSARFSVPKWKNLLSQREAFLHWKFREKLVLVGCNLFFHFGTENRVDQLKNHPVSHFICTFVSLLYLVISDAQYSKFVQHCVCSPVKWVTISQCKGDLARTTLMDKIPLKLWRWEELVLVDGKKFREICIQLPVHFFLIRNGSE